MKRLKPLQSELLACLILALLIGLLYGRTLFTSGELAYGKDVNYFYPNEVVLQASGFGADFPVWNPYFGAGAPGLGKIQVGLFYPPLMLLRALFDVETTLDLDAMLHLLLAGAGVYFLMRQLAVDRIPALFTAVAFMLSGSFTPRIIAGHASVLRAISWSGWLLWAYIRLLKEQTWLNVVLTALIVGFVITGGHPQMSLIVLLLPLGYFGACFVPECVRANNWRKIWSRFCWSVVAVGLALGLTAVQIMPYLAWQGQTVRAAGNAFDSFDVMIRNSFLWQHFLALFMPTVWYDPASSTSLSFENRSFFWENSAFTGVLTLLILGIGLTLRSTAYRVHRRFLAGLAVVGLVLSMGTINPLYEFLFQTLPYIRAPGRFMLWWTLATAVSAGIVLDIWLKNVASPVQFRKLAYGLAASALVLIVGWQLFRPLLPGLLQNYADFTNEYIELTRQTVGLNVNHLAVKLGVMTVLFWTVGRWPEYGRYLGILLVLVLSLEMGLFTTTITEPTPLSSLYHPESRYTQLDYSAEAHRFNGYRQPPLYLIPTLTHVQNGEESTKLDNLLKSDNGLNLLAANFTITQEALVDEGQLVQTRNGWNLFSHRQNLPRIYAAPVVRQVEADAAALPIVGDLAFSGWQEAVVLRPEDAKQAAQLNQFSAKSDNSRQVAFSGHYLQYQNNQLVAEVTTNQPVMVVFSEMYDAGWQASVNGQPATLWLVNYAFRGVLVDAGTSTISMQYRPQEYRFGAIISGLTGLFVLCLGVYQFMVNRRTAVD